MDEHPNDGHLAAPAGKAAKPKQPEDSETKDPNPPPVTTPTTKTINGWSVVVLADTTRLERGAHTSMEASVDHPGAETDGDGKVVKVDKPIPPTMTIQTAYGSDTNPASRSAYGRGTTDADVKNGDVTLGFHESCHRKDFLDYLATNKAPVFGGKAGMTAAEFNAAFDAFGEAAQAHGIRADRGSNAKTDEVGSPTRSAYLRLKADK